MFIEPWELRSVVVGKALCIGDPYREAVRVPKLAANDPTGRRQLLDLLANLLAAMQVSDDDQLNRAAAAIELAVSEILPRECGIAWPATRPPTDQQRPGHNRPGGG